LQAAQAVHAAFQFSHEHPSLVEPWFRDSQYLIVVAVPDIDCLVALAARADHAGVDVSLWHEPDLNGELTAITLAPGETSRRLCSNLPLAGRVMQPA
jgi:peptidyl-tRNA hydrolase